MRQMYPKSGQSRNSHSFSLFSIFVLAVFLDRIILGEKFWLWSDNIVLPLWSLSIYCRQTLQILSPYFLEFCLRSPTLNPVSFLTPKILELSKELPLPPTLRSFIFFSFSWSSGFLSCSLSHTWSCFPHSFSLPSPTQVFLNPSSCD